MSVVAACGMCTSQQALSGCSRGSGVVSGCLYNRAGAEGVESCVGGLVRGCRQGELQRVWVVPVLACLVSCYKAGACK